MFDEREQCLVVETILLRLERSLKERCVTFWRIIFGCQVNAVICRGGGSWLADSVTIERG